MTGRHSSRLIREGNGLDYGYLCISGEDVRR